MIAADRSGRADAPAPDGWPKRGVYPLSSPASNRKARRASSRGSTGPSSWAWPASQALPALHAQARAVGLAQGRDGLLEADRLDDQRPQLKLVVIGEARTFRVAILLERDGGSAGEVDRRQDLLVDPQPERDQDGPQASGALPRHHGGQLRSHDQAAVRARDADAAVHGFGEHDALSGIDRHPLDHVVADGAGQFGHQPGHREREGIPVGVHGIAVRAGAGHRRGAVEAPSCASSSSSP